MIDLDEDVVCTWKECSAAASLQAQIHLRDNADDPETSCHTGTVVMCKEHYDNFLVGFKQLPYTCPCGRLITESTDTVRWVREL